ncbi:hypothetical protein VNO77_28245 [Canavalia gladiata]|uniref:Uncharacterized protein n=1 Tax=Canavalia gladiata TaxID=3824 RepID=A0AAN9Q752_CANGL
MNRVIITGKMVRYVLMYICAFSFLSLVSFLKLELLLRHCGTWLHISICDVDNEVEEKINVKGRDSCHTLGTPWIGVLPTDPILSLCKLMKVFVVWFCSEVGLAETGDPPMVTLEIVIMFSVKRLRG